MCVCVRYEEERAGLAAKAGSCHEGLRPWTLGSGCSHIMLGD